MKNKKIIKFLKSERLSINSIRKTLVYSVNSGYIVIDNKSQERDYIGHSFKKAFKFLKNDVASYIG